MSAAPFWRYADTFCTTSATCFFAVRAMSACATMPQQTPLASTTGTRRIWVSSSTLHTFLEAVVGTNRQARIGHAIASGQRKRILALSHSTTDDIAVGNDTDWSPALLGIHHGYLAAIMLYHHVSHFLQTRLRRAAGRVLGHYVLHSFHGVPRYRFIT